MLQYPRATLSDEKRSERSESAKVCLPGQFGICPLTGMQDAEAWSEELFEGVQADDQWLGSRKIKAADPKKTAKDCLV